MTSKPSHSLVDYIKGEIGEDNSIYKDNNIEYTAVIHLIHVDISGDTCM